MPLEPDIAAYLLAYGTREPPALKALREATAGHRLAHLRTSPEQAALLAFLIRLSGARRCLEVGTFLGYSALAMALALPEGGKLVCCDLSASFAAVAQQHWEAANISHKIDLRLGPAQRTLATMLAEDEADRYDLIFIDADKPSYPFYVETALRLVRPGGLIVLDDVLLEGLVARPALDEPTYVGVLRALNMKLAHDPRVELVMLPIGDGMTLLRRR
ncbi:class I SAM-dependent methyltransferase [Chitinimonas lacunae]|uniref:Class I SAM-dependent methyltransferase n=1 Tax=Chitinimonas lacunae TaxID=1963018 RepID=A0ABV8MTQ0_9NEIS